MIVGSSAAWADEVTVFSENFETSTIAGLKEAGWTIDGNVSFQNKTLQIASGNGAGTVQTPTFSSLVGNTATLTFTLTSSSSSKTNTLTITGNNCKVDGEVSITKEAPATSTSSITISITEASTSSSITFSAIKSGGCRIDDLVVKYTEENNAKLKTIALSGTYPTIFTEGDAFSHEGMTVTATYDDESTKDVTENATFSGYDKNATGSQTVTVSYTEGGVTETATYEITVNALPTHNVTWSVNGATTQESYKEGAAITFPADPAEIEGKQFMGWVTTAINGTTNDAPTFVSTATMGTTDITYYAVFATATGSGENKTLAITADTEGIPSSYAAAKDYTIGGVKFNITQMYKNGAKLQWRAAGNSNGTGTMYNVDPLNIESIVLEYESGDNNKNFTVTVGNTQNPATGESITPTINGSVYTFDCSSIDCNYFVLTNGSGAGYLTSLTINYVIGSINYTDYCTTVAADTRADAELSFTPTEVSAEVGKEFTKPTLKTATGFNGTVEYTSSDEMVAQIKDTETGDLNIVGEGTATITATFIGNDDFKPGSASYTLTVTDNRIATTITQENIVLDIADIATLTKLAPVVKGAEGSPITYSYGEWPTEVSFEVVSDEDGIIGSLDNNSGDITLNATVGTATLKAYYNFYSVNPNYKPSECTFTITVESTMTIAEVREQAIGNVTTKGVVTSCAGTTAYIQDATAAICVYGQSLTVGDEVKVSGTLTTYNGLLEITSPTTTVLSSGNTVTPDVMTIAEINTSDKQGWLVKIENATVTAISSKNVTIEQGGESIVVRFNDATDITLAVNNVITLTGNIGCYNGVQIANPTDITVAADTTPSVTVSETEINVDAAEHEGTITVTYANISDINADVVFCDATGAEAEAKPTWITAGINSENNNIDYLIEANTGEARTAYMKVYALDDDANDVYSELITITQAAYVAPEQPVDPAVAGVGCFVKVTSTADITAGNYLIVYEGNDTHDAVAFNGGLETLDAANNGIAVTIIDDKVLATDATVAATFTIQSGSLKSASGKYIGRATYANGIDDDETALANTFEIDDNGNAVITAEGKCTLRYNYNSDQLRFRYYKSGQQAVSLYKYDATAANPSINIEVTSAGYATYCYTEALDFTNVEGLTAYRATVTVTATESKVDFQPVTKVPAGEGVLLKGEAKTYSIPVIASADAIENDFIGVLKETEITETGIFVLLDGGNGTGFYKTKSAFTVGAHTAYLPAQAGGNGAREFIAIDDNTTTGVNSIDNGQLTIDNVYNLNGQRVNNAKKGLYIVNGKKVVIK